MFCIFLLFSLNQCGGSEGNHSALENEHKLFCANSVRTASRFQFFMNSWCLSTLENCYLFEVFLVFEGNFVHHTSGGSRPL